MTEHQICCKEANNEYSQYDMNSQLYVCRAPLEGCLEYDREDFCTKCDSTHYLVLIISNQNLPKQICQPKAEITATDDTDCTLWNENDDCIKCSKGNKFQKETVDSKDYYVCSQNMFLTGCEISKLDVFFNKATCIECQPGYLLSEDGRCVIQTQSSCL